MDGFTQTEQQFLRLLSDGMPHKIAEICSVLDVSRGYLAVVACKIRKKLPRGQILICEVRDARMSHYRHARLLHSPND